MPLDPQVEIYLAKQAATAGPAPVTADDRRSQRRRETVMLVEDRIIAGPVSDLTLRIYTPAGRGPLPCLVYFHGGGWVTGDLDISDLHCRLLARWAGCVVVHVNYRHAPEHPFPAASDDAFAGTRWVAANSQALGIDSDRIAVGGDSAGANLAAAVTLMARDAGTPHIAFQYLAYPVTDGSMSHASYQANSAGFGLTAAGMSWFWDQYVPDKSQRSNPLASPIDADDLSGLPPAIVMTAEFDPLRDEGEAYAKRLSDAGVAVHVKRYDGMVHGFLNQAGEVDAARGALVDLVQALRKALSD